jgi:hypothetical protein
VIFLKIGDLMWLIKRLAKNDIARQMKMIASSRGLPSASATGTKGAYPTSASGLK